MILNLVIVLVLFEQKSIVRSSSTQITFVAFLLSIFLLYQLDIFLLNKFSIKFKQRILGYIFAISLVFIIGLHSNNNFKLDFANNPFYVFRIGDINKVIYQKSNQCYSKNLSNLLNSDTKYRDVENTIKKKSKNPKIFSYLSDTAFYILFDQMPPYYFTIFEATPLYAQKANIKYIHDQNVNYIIYNINLTKLSDGVPEYVRGSDFLRYVLINFVPYDKKKNYIILKKANNKDFFEDLDSNQMASFRDHLLNIDFAAIPESEGVYKADSLNLAQNTSLINSSSLEEVNRYLHDNTITSANKFIILKAVSYKDTGKNIILKITSSDNITTVVSFYRCKLNKSCIVDVSRIPLFYKEKKIKRIEIDKNFIGKIDLMSILEKNKLW